MGLGKKKRLSRFLRELPTFSSFSKAPPQPIFFPKFQILFADFPNSTFLPLARDCASWEPAADISTALTTSGFFRPQGFQGWINDNKWRLQI